MVLRSRNPSETFSSASAKPSNMSISNEEDYEAQRAANIKANLELMMSLGLYHSSAAFKPPVTPRAKPVPKAKATTPEGSEEGSQTPTEKVERPRRITRSVSRNFDEPLRRSGRGREGGGRGMKRALSDDASSFSLTSRKVSRLERDNLMWDAESSDDDEYSSPSKRKSSSSSSSGPLNPSRAHRDPSTLQRTADRLGTRIHDPKTFGSIPGIPVGTVWSKRMDCSTDAVHAPTVAGISGNETTGCWSICLSGGYEDDVDLGETFTYTGSGGRDLKGTKANPKNLRTAPKAAIKSGRARTRPYDAA